MDGNIETATSLRVVIPVIYILIGIISIAANGIALQVICANRFRHKALHILLNSIIVEDMLFTVIFVIIRTVSYSSLNVDWFINVNNWCKAEMYLLRLFDFVLAYTIIFICFDRLVKPGSCWFSIRSLRTGFAFVISIWAASAYILIPILIFQQTIVAQKAGGYLCQTTDESVPLYWLGTYPRRILDFIDIIFRIMFPIFLMIVFTIAIVTSKYTLSQIKKYKSVRAESSSSNLHSPRTKFMVLGFVLVFIITELPFEIYRAVMLWNKDTESDLQNNGLTFAIEMPLLILKLLNRAINPFLILTLADKDYFRRKFCRLWCIPCIPGCIGCQECWCTDCANSFKYEYNTCMGKEKETDNDNWVPTGSQTVTTVNYLDGETLVTRKTIREEYEKGVQPYYKNLELANNPNAFETIPSTRPVSVEPVSRSNVNLAFENNEISSRDNSKILRA